MSGAGEGKERGGEIRMGTEQPILVVSEMSRLRKGSKPGAARKQSRRWPGAQWRSTYPVNEQPGFDS